MYDLVLLPDGRLDEFLALSVVSNAKNFLTILGWNIYSLDRLLYIEGYKSVEILNGCNALTLMALYSGFIVSFNGTFVNRAKFLLIGVFAIYVLNVVRIMSFSIATVYFQHYWNLFHEFSPFLFFYPIVLYLWYQWTIVGQNNPTPSYSDLSLS
ncbi:MAG: archaeosortase/exosortase family protein [Candidatus Marinimicrobia bacterium]|nr:archaeosortase/exosortase family protein [Candidatus Neomarinimicrobiota bacterium]